MFKPRVVFRADGNSEIGLGHIVRCLALANMLKESFECIFIVRSSIGNSISILLESGFNFFVINDTITFDSEVVYLSNTIIQKGDIVVLDGYSFGLTYQSLLKRRYYKVVCIDDLHQEHFVADMIINHAGNVSEKDYSCELNTKLLLGYDYALLRREFLIPRKQKKTLAIYNIFICFGGADPINFTERVIDICIKQGKIVHAVLGHANTSKNTLLNKYSKNDQVNFYFDLDSSQMLNLMLKCDFAVAPTSSIGYEICAVGLVWFGGPYVDNQLDIFHGFLKRNCLKAWSGMGENMEAELEIYLKTLQQDEIFHMLNSQHEIINGKSAQNILQNFILL